MNTSPLGPGLCLTKRGTVWCLVLKRRSYFIPAGLTEGWSCWDVKGEVAYPDSSQWPRRRLSLQGPPQRQTNGDRAWCRHQRSLCTTLTAPLEGVSNVHGSSSLPQQEMWLLTLSGMGSVLNHEGWSPVSHVTAQPHSAFYLFKKPSVSS